MREIYSCEVDIMERGWTFKLERQINEHFLDAIIYTAEMVG